MVDYPRFHDAQLSRLRFFEGKTDFPACGRGFRLPCKLGHPRVVGVVHQCLLDVSVDLGLVGRIIGETSMPIEMVVGQIGDCRAFQSHGLREMQLERTQFDAECLILRIDCGMGYGFADVAYRRSDLPRIAEHG
jgi:hypothetical protein